MARSFASGMVWGLVVAGGALVLISQLAPPPKGLAVAGNPQGQDVAAKGEGAVPTEAVPTAQTAAKSPDATASLPDANTLQTATKDITQPETATPDAAAAPAEPVVTQDQSSGGKADSAAEGGAELADAGGAAVQKQAEAPVVQADQAGPDAVAKPATPLPKIAAVPAPDSEPDPALSSLDAALTAPEADQAPVAHGSAPDPIGTKDQLLVPSQGAGLTEPSRLPQITAEDPNAQPAPLPVVTAPDTGDAQPEAPQKLAPRVITPDAPKLPGAEVAGVATTLPTVLKPSVPGGETNKLPHVGDNQAAEIQVPTAGTDERPLVKYARSFDRSGGKPLFAILLRDIGAAGMARADLALLPFPVTFVVDPLAPDAAEAAAAYRAAGQEVLMLANGIPAGATASDVAQSFQTLQDILPETVGVIDQATAGFQDNRPLATLVLPVIADQGRGLVTYDRGLNAADQIARRDGLPAAVIFRRLDGEGESQPVMRRYLDRAAFKAAQEGSVVVIGDTRADTVAAILQWTIEGKASGVDLAPVTAVIAQKR